MHDWVIQLYNLVMTEWNFKSSIMIKSCPSQARSQGRYVGLSLPLTKSSPPSRWKTSRDVPTNIFLFPINSFFVKMPSSSFSFGAVHFTLLTNNEIHPHRANIACRRSYFIQFNSGLWLNSNKFDNMKQNLHLIGTVFIVIISRTTYVRGFPPKNRVQFLICFSLK